MVGQVPDRVVEWGSSTAITLKQYQIKTHGGGDIISRKCRSLRRVRGSQSEAENILGSNGIGGKKIEVRLKNKNHSGFQKRTKGGEVVEQGEVKLGGQDKPKPSQ